MKRMFIRAGLALLAATGAMTGAEPAKPATAARVDYPSFRIIPERNIFNPNRSKGYVRPPSPPSTYSPPERRSRTESFVLLGTLSYEKGSFAFFDGSNSDYHRVIEPDGTIASYRITEITPTHVKLESTNGPAIEMPVGMQMRRQDEGEWLLTARAESSGSLSRASASSAGTGGGSSEEASEVLKRLMQKRDQEGSAEAAASPDSPAVTVATTGTTNQVQKADAGSAGDADEVLKKLMQKREQELNK